MEYRATTASLRNHPMPAWYEDAKLGIFIHWGLFSVPAWAPTSGEVTKVIAEQGWKAWFTNNAYAEWYLNTMGIAGSPTARYHAATYGTMPYEGFMPLFNEAVRNWDPDPFANALREAGARYAVLVTKHHDGFTLWCPLGPRYGRVEVWLDERLLTSLDLYAVTASPSEPVYTLPDLGRGYHAVALLRKSGTMPCDVLQVNL